VRRRVHGFGEAGVVDEDAARLSAARTVPGLKGCRAVIVASGVFSFGGIGIALKLSKTDAVCFNRRGSAPACGA